MDSQIITILSTRLEALHGDVGEIKGAMNNLAAAITKLALIEERQTTTNAALERAFGAIKRCEERLLEVEKKLPEISRASVWVDRGVWAAAAAAVMYVAKKAGLI
jgi:exonuclease VII small subunit